MKSSPSEPLGILEGEALGVGNETPPPYDRGWAFLEWLCLGRKAVGKSSWLKSALFSSVVADSKPDNKSGSREVGAVTAGRGLPPPPPPPPQAASISSKIGDGMSSFGLRDKSLIGVSAVLLLNS